MKLLRAHIENFRLLRDATFEFATDAALNVTVIRAANESGKTTLLTALQWGLFGNEALPERGVNYRLSPIDISSGTVPVSVEIDYEIPTRTGSVQHYRIIQSASERVLPGGTWERDRTRVSLFNLTSIGTERMDNPAAHIEPHLPSDLREVFFTDGDRALSFIEGSRVDQMKRVEGAIQSLLGLETVERARDHAHQVGSDLNRRIRKDVGARDELQTITDKLADLEQELPAVEDAIRRAKDEHSRLEDLELEADKKLTDALRQGNKTTPISSGANCLASTSLRSRSPRRAHCSKPCTTSGRFPARPSPCSRTA